jgi:hypothetical protein
VLGDQTQFGNVAQGTSDGLIANQIEPNANGIVWSRPCGCPYSVLRSEEDVLNLVALAHAARARSFASAVLSGGRRWSPGSP